MKEKTFFGKAGVRKKFAIDIAAVAIVLMLTLGVSISQYQHGVIVNKKLEKNNNGRECKTTFEVGSIDYCFIANNAITCFGDAIAQGYYTFDELQEYINEHGIPGSTVASKESTSTGTIISGGICFGQIQQGGEIGGKIAKPESLKFNVVEILKERFPQAIAYCQGGEPADWRFHPEAICLAASLIPILGVCMATGVVTAFFALFGTLSYLLGTVFWGLLLRGFGILDPQMLEFCLNVYEICMGLIG